MQVRDSKTDKQIANKIRNKSLINLMILLIRVKLCRAKAISSTANQFMLKKI